MQAELVNVHRIHAASGAFAAVRHDGKVISWGDPRGGGNSRDVSEYLNSEGFASSTSPDNNPKQHGVSENIQLPSIQE